MKPKDCYDLDIHLCTSTVRSILESELVSGKDVPVRPEDLTDELMKIVAETLRCILVRGYTTDVVNAMEALKDPSAYAKNLLFL